MKTIQHFTLLVVLLMCMQEIYAQDNEADVNGSKIDIEVQKDTGEEGNIVRIDSSFTWSWSGSDNLDSIMSAFGDKFNVDFDFPMDFSFDFQMPDINLSDFRFNSGDSTVALEDLDEFLNDLHLKTDPFEHWGGEEAFRKHFEEKFDQNEFEKRIEDFFDVENFQDKMEQFMNKQQQFLEKNSEMLEKYQKQEFKGQKEEIHNNRYQYKRDNGIKAI